MHFLTAIAALLPVGAALAATHTITVGLNGTLTFTPDSINATVGDTLDFSFVSGNHTITQSSFATPCSLFKAANGSAGVDSGYKPGTESDPATFSFAINDTSAPLWFYCRHPGHCEQGMVFAVNAPITGAKTFEAFQTAAKATNANTTSSSSSTASSSSSSSTAPPSTTSTASGAGVLRAGSAGAILGLAGLLAGLVL
ncbi:hypothetical protein POSPLADRAFT_1175527 [Postia placenta MAD-698-R-SB12]|uniref:Phytocyanin domain-containing protein n=1 Tax=Postia placenta MAD-698-R-SB12 TaxID=670580 RepID=A0A1X6NEA9_9APHY|nr:hypothetical protein POSPLADRAFT_1175527 [Postia placenta MAD-698-R-SB12]OSX66840.1 hypothetical protein POSPLADRAFT_1175527 [Postia placenta MAD-698-R-SB12]